MPEKFVDGMVAAEFLSVTPRRVLDMARAGAIPAHPLGRGKRKTWRFKLAELENAISHEDVNCTLPGVGRTKGAGRIVGSDTGK
jgi:hypothetical protein